jgi:hypothetical protein
VLEEKLLQDQGGNPCKIYQTTEKGHDLLTDINKTLTYFK